MNPYVWIVIVVMSYESSTMMYACNPPRPARVYYEEAKVFNTDKELAAFLEPYLDKGRMFDGGNARYFNIKAIYKAQKVEYELKYEEESRPKQEKEHDKKLREIILKDGA